MKNNEFKMKIDRLRGNKAAKVLSLLAIFVMPVSLAAMVAFDDLADIINPYYLLFLGFYGCIFMCLSWERKWLWLKILLCLGTAAINGFIILVAFVGSEVGPLLAFLMMIIPVPWFNTFG